MNHVRAPTDGFTNQRVLNVENAKKIYKALRDRHNVDSSLITLRPMFYSDPIGNLNDVKLFKGVGSKEFFFKCLESMPGDSMEEKRQCFFNGITWEPVDGQHVQHACNVLAKNDLLVGKISQEDYNKIFARRPATIVLHDNEITYLFSSTRLNDITTERKYHSTTGEMLEKARILWESLGRPSAENENRKKFLRSMPSITSTRMGDGKISIIQMREKFRDYTVMATLPDACWEALKEMCDAYDNSVIFKSKKHKNAELGLLTSNKGKKMKDSIVERPRMFVGWLRPLQGLTANEHILLYKQLTVNSVDKDQVLWFDRNKSEPELAHSCEVAKRRAGIQNTFKWLEAVRIDPKGEKKNWLQTDVEKFGGKDALDYFAKDIPKSNEFLKRWCYINSQTAHGKQHKHVDFIPRNVIDHHQLVVEGGVGLFCNGKVIPRNDEGNWKMSFHYEGANSMGLSTEVKIGDSVFTSDGGTFGRSALWVFDCRYGPTNAYWTEVEYTSIMKKIELWMGDVQRWNVIFMLPVGENVEHIKSLIGLNNVPEYFLHIGTYIFGSQSETTGLVVKDGSKCIAKFSPIGQYIVVLRHPLNTSLEENFAKNKGAPQTIHSYYIEPSNGWSMCSKNRTARCPAVVEELVGHFFSSDWMLVMEGFSHLIENVSGRVEQLILMESNLDMEVWLEKWKERYVDKVRQALPDKNPLWLDKEKSKDDFDESDEDDTEDDEDDHDDDSDGDNEDEVRRGVDLSKKRKEHVSTPKGGTSKKKQRSTIAATVADGNSKTGPKTRLKGDLKRRPR